MERSKRNWFMLILGVFLFSALVYATTTITDESIIMDDGTVIGVQNISMKDGGALFFVDDATGDIRAIFNSQNLSFVSAMAQTDINITGTGGITSFLGSVDNFDNINGFSRFKETNINSGQFAAAGFTAVNDIGFNITFGIGSSNFFIGGVTLNNTPAIQSNAPAPFRFVNRDKKGFTWRANTNNDINNGTSVVGIMNLTFDGSLDIRNNYSGTQIQLDSQDPKPTCTSELTGTIVYEQNGSKGDYFGCKMQNTTTFVWAKFS